MKKISFVVPFVAVLMASGAALAQAPSPGPASPGPAPAAKLEPATEAKFLAADKDKSGALEGAELDAMKADLVKIDANKDGKVSKEEFAVAMKAGLIK